MRTSLCAAAVFAALSVPGVYASEETQAERFDLLKSAEILAHRSLMRRISKEPDSLSEFETDGCCVRF